ncbi:4-(cytidine 5'-diphospho)-2-C-methyl-D-erythritol kinase [Rhodoplanes sp. TEM]|uniref:4-diphosphocytidyl-2-C-methyl-D-erythritol kinase n=1 Tax=Rhodoplanes tepidamans TaxID=200616 RepID=A0ABT5J4E8_RHOTP|nr:MULTISPECIES: 4-(cytidine 5'-diphospho)-2-C-methyl-D-erythritol kinase [Rhodoplanes]MDC7784510.1 4-(cytidine 5'-diphospho)-2-C-methyl-D-erythritol kinase [Rhodoplanes tepidamans]MDC7987941.1 4-(cytidine 5'-diphospho)-2-C-methyl-D-erythritol kinase [Rhodoplanes sp. TEM]MDQ0355738.1 4-diphosphocytidyl-2-C-methyl-D-erythritol kinase [Rhodoplanes tepidamans]
MTATLDTDLLEDTAPAKVNLTLRILGRRADGYHELESLVTFTSLGDRLTLAPGTPARLDVSGPTAVQAGPVADNLVLKAARLLAERVPDLALGAFDLVKRLPAGGGLGGGSSDAAAALRLLARVNGLSLDDPRIAEAAVTAGADVPVCLAGKPRIMRGIGEVLSPPVALPPLFAVLVGPGFPLATRDVFTRLGLTPGERRGEPTADADLPADADGLYEYLAENGNDLEPPAIAIAPKVGELIAMLRRLRGCRLARMSGSGSTCFALFDDPRAAADAAVTLGTSHPSWWVQATALAR